MDFETFKKAVALNSEIEVLEEIQEQIAKRHEYQLKYVGEVCDKNGVRHQRILDNGLYVVDKILQKHDCTIQEEIQEEIEKLKREVLML